MGSYSPDEPGFRFRTHGRRVGRTSQIPTRRSQSRGLRPRPRRHVACGRRAELERRFGAEFQWRRLDENKVSIIAYAQPFDGYVRENWPAMIAWLADHVTRLEKTFDPEIDALRHLLRSRFPREAG